MSAVAWVPDWYWGVSSFLFGFGCVVEAVGVFVLGVIAAVTAGCRDDGARKFIRNVARALTLAPFVTAAAYLAWPLIAIPGLFLGGRILYRLAWAEPPDEKANRLRRERDDRDATIRRLEYEAGIR